METGRGLSLCETTETAALGLNSEPGRTQAREPFSSEQAGLCTRPAGRQAEGPGRAPRWEPDRESTDSQDDGFKVMHVLSCSEDPTRDSVNGSGRPGDCQLERALGLGGAGPPPRAGGPRGQEPPRPGKDRPPPRRRAAVACLV